MLLFLFIEANCLTVWVKPQIFSVFPFWVRDARTAPLCENGALLSRLFTPLREAIGKRGVVFFEGVPRAFTPRRAFQDAR